MNIEGLNLQRCGLAKASELWQFDLLTPGKLKQFAYDHGIHVFNSNRVIELWSAGLVRSDLILTSKKINIHSIDLVHEENEHFIYCDKRRVQERPQGFGGILSELDILSDDLKLWFHPFRLYVLYHIDRVFSLNMTSIFFL